MSSAKFYTNPERNAIKILFPQFAGQTTRAPLNKTVSTIAGVLWTFLPSPQK